MTEFQVKILILGDTDKPFVKVIDNGSDEPFEAVMVKHFNTNLRLVYLKPSELNGFDQARLKQAINDAVLKKCELWEAMAEIRLTTPVGEAGLSSLEHFHYLCHSIEYKRLIDIKIEKIPAGVG